MPKFSGRQIKMMYDYVQEHGEHLIYTVGNVIPEGSVGYKQYISTKGKEKKQIVDYELI